MNLEKRKALLVRLGTYMAGKDEAWQAVKQRAFAENNWFIPEFVDLAASNIAQQYLQPAQLDLLASRYQVPAENSQPKKVGIVMAGNIPLVGFHDLLCVFLAGHHAMVKPSSKDEVLVRHLADQMTKWDEEVSACLTVSEMIRNCDAYIATGSNNSSRYFEYYFRKYPSIIRRNRTSVALLRGDETPAELDRLADDVYQYFGLGCRNVTKIFVPEHYDFVPLLEAFRKYDYLANHHKYKNNYDYNLAVHILNNQFYMSNGSILLVENESPFSPIAQLHYQYYKDLDDAEASLQNNENIQCVVSASHTSFGQAQVPEVCDFADGTDTMAFLMKL
ncbi:MAG TPA: acyl-CoA reductase [Flavisolibacter sp.]|nr:acyl-CoA reductase [Flavisolibacter sp.]